MKTQISKESHRPAKRYSGIYEQQGRMLTDADWGELMELVKQRLNDALHDVINTGAPRERGVEISKDENGSLQINGTHLYADGVKAIVAPKDGSPGDKPFPYDKQADFPDPPELPPPLPSPVPTPQEPVIYIYGDVWERPVIALEDEQLLDPALHGADTCTRTQTMAQIKWCPVDKEPETTEDNPQKGNAQVTVSLHTKLAEKDPCDPCADVVAPEARIGNYLFRVEVHDVKGPADAPNEVTLKWSSENGAEQHAVDAAPDDFKNGDWVWEIYDLTSEKHLGIHLVDDFIPQRGELVTSSPESPAEEKKERYVRRWDGYVVLKRQADGTYVPATDADGEIIGKDKNAQLSESADPADKSHGAVLPGDAFKVNLESLTLTVILDDKTVVAGDYWLAVVRENIHDVGATVLEAAEPLGILHHYIKLAQLRKDGTLVEWEEGSPEYRKLNFPPLTDIHAGDVGYTTQCDSGLFTDSHDTVKKALDQICHITAEHVAFTKPCETSLYKDVPPGDVDTVAKALTLLCDVRAEHVGFDKKCDTSIYKGVDPAKIPTVQDALELFCDIRADQISYKAEEKCKLLAKAETVKEALDLLCARPTGTGGGCQVAVGHGEFPTIEEAIRALTERYDFRLTVFNLCLLPGEHVLPSQEFFDDLRNRLSGLFSLLLCGSGMESTFLIVEKPMTLLEMHTFCSQNLTIVGGNAGMYLTLRCEQINFKHIHFDALIRDPANVALILDGREQVHVIDCIIMAQDDHSFDIPRDVFNYGGDDLNILAELFTEDVVIVRTTFMREAWERSMFLVQPAQAEMRNAMAQAVSVEIKKYELTAEETESYDRLIASLTEPGIDVQLFARRLAGDLDRVRFAAASAAASRDPAVAVMIPSAQADCLFDHNDIIGRFSIYGMPPRQSPESNEMQAMHDKLVPLIQSENILFKSTQRKLQLRNNHFTQLLVAERVIKELEGYGQGRGKLEGVFETMLLSDNVFRAANNFFVARGHSFTATRFDHESDLGTEGEASQPAGIVFGDNAVYVGTVGKSEFVDPAGDRTYADIKLYDTTRNPRESVPTESATFRLEIVRNIPQ